MLEALVQEMEDRYRAFAKARTRDLPTYNAKVSAEERLPMVFLVHDEFADWMLDDAYKAAVGAAVQRLGVKARAAGIHLIFAAQRPDKDVMPMQLRENLGNRLILKVSSEAPPRSRSIGPEPSCCWAAATWPPSSTASRAWSSRRPRSCLTKTSRRRWLPSRQTMALRFEFAKLRGMNRGST